MLGVIITIRRITTIIIEITIIIITMIKTMIIIITTIHPITKRMMFIRFTIGTKAIIPARTPPIATISMIT